MTTDTITELDQFYADVFTTALEGGIGYWSACTQYHWTTDGTLEGADIKGFFATIELIVNDEINDKSEFRIDREVIVRGVALLKPNDQQLVADDYAARIREGYRDRDAGEIDALGADCIVQAGLFGKVIYG